MKIKHLAIMLLAASCAVGSAEAKKLKDLKVYINPGHGGYTSNDRPIQIYPFAKNDTAGYWESKSNLYKGLHMYHILDSLGAKPYLSRIKNTEDDDRSLSGIAAEANQLGCDLFFSIHSNAGENVNYPIMLYRENTIGTPRYPENVTLSNIMWDNLHSSQLPHWTRNTPYVEGDLTFYQNMWQGGLGVLRTLYVVGLLSEGGMHEHQPEAHRLMNDDYLWLEAWHFVKSIMDFYNDGDRFVTGNVAGVVYDSHNLRERDYKLNFSNFGRDRFAPLNGAYVELLDASGKIVQKRTTDNMYNGVFVFRNVAPGNYTLHAVRDDYHQESRPVTVTAHAVAYQDMPLVMKRPEPLAITSYTPCVDPDKIDTDAVSCAATIDFEFNYDVDTESLEKAFTITPAVDGYWEYSESYTKARYVPALSLERDQTYTVTVDGSVRHADTYNSGAEMGKPLTFSFKTRSRSRLELIDNFPHNNGQVHYVSPSVELRFDNLINTSNLYDAVSVTDDAGNALAVNKRATKNNQLTNGYGNTVLTLSANLEVGKKYKLKLSDALRDRENLPLGESFEFEFTAVDAAAEAPEQTLVADFEGDNVFAYDPEYTKGIGTVLPTALKSTSVKLFDKASARLGYTFTDNHGGEVVWNYTGDPLQFNTNDVVGVYVNGDFNNHELWLGFTSGSNKKYTKLTDLDFLGWQYRECKLENLEADFCPFLFSDVKLVQKQSPITQKGYFALDNLGRRESDNGVNDILADADANHVSVGQGLILVDAASADAIVSVTTVDGRVIARSTGSMQMHVAAGLYIITVDSNVYKVSVK